MSADHTQAEAFTFGMEKVPATDKDCLTVVAHARALAKQEEKS